MSLRANGFTLLSYLRGSESLRVRRIPGDHTPIAFVVSMMRTATGRR